MGSNISLNTRSLTLRNFVSVRESSNVVVMKVLLVALFCFTAAMANPLSEPAPEDNDLFKECITTHGMKCYKTCIPPMQECIQAAGHDFMKTLACGADYIKCGTHCE